MAIKPSVTTQLRNANARIKELEALVVEKDKKIKELEDSKKYYSDRANEAEKEVEAVHDFLDSMPNAVDRTYVKQGGWGDTKRSAIARLTAWLIVKDVPTVKSTFEANN